MNKVGFRGDRHKNPTKIKKVMNLTINTPFSITLLEDSSNVLAVYVRTEILIPRTPQLIKNNFM